MPGPTEPRIMLYSAEAPEGRVFSADDAAAKIEEGWSDTPVPAAAADENDGDEPTQDALALALAAFVTIPSPVKDDWLALATAMEAPTEVFGMNANDLKVHLGQILENGRQPLTDAMLPWSFGDWANAIRELMTEPDGGAS